MARCRLLLTGALAAGAMFVPTTSSLASASSANLAAPACTDSWRVPVSGAWSDAADWTNGIPGEAGPVAACITVAGTYTVTLAPWAIGGDIHNGAGIESLVLGATVGEGKQTLVVDGQSSTSDSNEQLNSTFVNTTATSVIRARGVLVLATTDGGTRPKDVPYGGVAAVTGGAFLNYGAVRTKVQEARNKAADQAQFLAQLTNEPDGSVTDQSGQLEVNSVTNDGSWTVAPGASLDLAFQSPGSGYNSGVFTNSGTVINEGSISAQQGTWAQVGGPVKGNAVVLQDGATLMDRSGAAKFLVNQDSAQLFGTVPAGQTITVVGEPFSYQGDEYYSTALGLGGKTLINNGAIVLEAQGTKTTGGAAELSDGAVRNNGAIVAEAHKTAWTVVWTVGLTNNRSGTVTVASGTTNQAGDGSDANAGTIMLAPGAVWLLQQGSAFTNQRGGRVVPEIAGPSRFGQFQVASPCCNGAGALNAGGALRPALVGGYQPVAGKEFPLFSLVGGKFVGTFNSVQSPFTADYAHETNTPAFVGVIYKSSKLKTAKI